MFAFALVFVAGMSLQQSSGAAGPEDAAVTAVFERTGAGSDDFDAELVSRNYADDADWTNAFGVRRKGSTQIRAYLSELFGRPQFRSRAPSGPATVSIKFVRPEVAVVRSFRVVAGQRGPNNEELLPRRIHRQLVMTKERGAWVIVSELVMDERRFVFPTWAISDRTK